jgi:transglutaminase-like putative cysteine protease
MGGGHVWAEVYLTNIGWVQVNPTTGRTIEENYLPLFTTSDGNMTFVYRSFPVMNKLAAEHNPGGDVPRAAPDE